MKSDVLEIGPLMSLQAPFFVPKYQRGYAWDTEEVHDFVEDVRAVHEGSGRHFFGGLVSIRRHDLGTPAGVSYEIVDGQQRLTTFFLCLHSIIEGYRLIAREASQNDDAKTARTAESTAATEEETYLCYLSTDSQGNRIRPYKLRLSRVDADFFEALLRRKSFSGLRAHSHRLLRRADETIRRRLVDPIVQDENQSVAEKFERLKHLRQSLTDHCYLVHLVSENDNEAYELFVVLNDRGKSLSEAELLRTHTLKLLENYIDKQETAEKLWEPIISRKPTEVIEFLRYYWASLTGRRWPSRGLHDAYVEQVFGKTPVEDDGSAHRVVDQIRRLNGEHETYARIRRGEWPYDDPHEHMWIQVRLARLVRTLRLDASLPLLLSAARRDERFFASVVLTLERFAFRYLVSGGHASEMGDRLYEEAKKLREDDDYGIDDLKRACRKLLLKYARDAAFESGMVNRLRYQTTGNNSLLRYFLTTVEDHYEWLTSGAAGEPKLDKLSITDLTQATIEHIYPQTPRFGERIPELDPYVHELGNLSFWGPGENPRASNLSFETKKLNHYPMSKIHLIAELADLDRWTKNQLEDRQQRLLEWGKLLFPIPETLEAEEEPSPTWWFVRHDPQGEYADRQSEVFEYAYGDSSTLNIAEGDVLVRCLPTSEAPDGRRVLGFGRVHRLVPDGDLILAIFDRYQTFARPLTLGEVGVDARRVRGTATRVDDQGVIDRLLQSAGVTTPGQLPEVEIGADLRAADEDGWIMEDSDSEG